EPVSEPNDPERDEQEPDAQDDLAEDESDAEDDPELDFGAEVAAARAAAAGLEVDSDPDPSLGDRPYTKEEAGLRSKVGWGRSPIVSVAVIIVGLFLLVATWSDFAYFLHFGQSAPRELGQVGDIYQGGEFSERFDNEWVHLQGEPDVQHAARMETREGWVGFLRLIEADASLFVAVPRDTEKASNEFPGEFSGRIVRLQDSPQWDKLQQFFKAEEIVDLVDLKPASVEAALASTGQSGALAGPELDLVTGGTTTLGADEQVRVIARMPVGMAQLGRDTWKTQEQAEATIAALGVPWTFVEKRNMFWVFAVWTGPNAEVDVFQRMTRALNGGEDLVGADPKKGALVLPRRATYLTTAGDLQGKEGRVSFTYGENTAGTGWVVSGDKLTEVGLEDGRLQIPAKAVEEVRVERQLAINPKGYLLMVDQKPTDVWPSAVMFGAVLGVVLLNLWALVTTLRRRRASAAA
ncbi:MAG: hypothetical protein KC431_19290, partial [Myxococcales bacterium]|nr:hypothetical protein [Myxococcales bacterium]